jgi:CubicO group peptidase (beta-lactamase class C family)
LPDGSWAPRCSSPGGGELAYERYAGNADREDGTPVDERTLFRLASMTKPMVSAATLALVEGGGAAAWAVR